MNYGNFTRYSSVIRASLSKSSSDTSGRLRVLIIYSNAALVSFRYSISVIFASSSTWSVQCLGKCSAIHQKNNKDVFSNIL